jgi:tRNA 2-thiocytidine biosynthesis protein TtcA
LPVGGKDSYTLLAALIELKWRGLLPAELLACNLDQGQPGFPATVLPEFLEPNGRPAPDRIPRHLLHRRRQGPEGRTYCALCSRLRRGHLYRIAREEGCSAVVLGHHRDDILETFFMNLFHGGRLATMPPKLVNEEGDPVRLSPARPCGRGGLREIRPRDELPDHPLRPLRLQDGLQRQQVKAILDGWERNSPGRRQVMFRALMNARPSHLLDPKLWDFAGLALKESGPPAGRSTAGAAAAADTAPPDGAEEKAGRP